MVCTRSFDVLHTPLRWFTHRAPLISPQHQQVTNGYPQRNSSFNTIKHSAALWISRQAGFQSVDVENECLQTASAQSAATKDGLGMMAPSIRRCHRFILNRLSKLSSFQSIRCCHSDASLKLSNLDDLSLGFSVIEQNGVLESFCLSFASKEEMFRRRSWR